MKLNLCVNRKCFWGLILLFLQSIFLSCNSIDIKEREIDKIGRTQCNSFILYMNDRWEEPVNYTCKYSIREKIDYDTIYEDFCLMTINMKEKRWSIPQQKNTYVIFSEKTNLYEALNENIFPMCKKKFYDKPFDLIELHLFLGEKVASNIVLLEHESKNIVFYTNYYPGKFLPKEFKEKYEK